MYIKKGVDIDLPQILDNYFHHGLHPGAFYKAVIHNDLRCAIANAHPLIDITATIQAIDRWISIDSIKTLKDPLALLEDIGRAMLGNGVRYVD